LGAGSPQRCRTIGFWRARALLSWRSSVPGFVQGLTELGWIEGRPATIVYRWAGGRPERYTEIAAEFVRLKVDVIVSSGTAVVAAKQVTSVIPIVFAVATDPLGSGLVANLARPGGSHRLVEPDVRSFRQASRNFAPGCPPSSPVGDTGPH